MATLTAPTEFTLQRRVTQRTRGPARWIWSHAVHYWPILLMLVLGAVGNAALAAAIPVLVGSAFNDMLKPNPDLRALVPLALILGGSQIVRGVLQFGRNFGAELMAQKVERDIRDELYVSLLGKSMTFHNLQPVGDTMARATNDVREVNFMFSPGLNLVVGSALFILVPLFIVPGYHPALLLTPLLFVVGYFLALWQYLRTMSPVTDEVRQTFGDMNTHLSETLDGVEIMKGAAQEGGGDRDVRDQRPARARRLRAAGRHRGPLPPHAAVRARPRRRAGPRPAPVPRGAVQHRRRGGLLRPAAHAGFPHLHFVLRLHPDLARPLRRAPHPRVDESTRRNLDQNAAGYTGDLRGEIEFRGVWFAYPGSLLPSSRKRGRRGVNRSSRTSPSRSSRDRPSPSWGRRARARPRW